MNIKYNLLNPAGNMTIIVTTPVKENDRRFVADALMKAEPSSEQVGFLESNVLNMAGGEFCGNATRCASFISGCKEIVCAGQTIKCDGTAAYIPKALQGIEMHVFENEIADPENEIKKVPSDNAIGFMFWNEKESKLKPLVYVPGADTLFWENSCASGTAALGTYLAKKYNKAIDLDINEPGGVLHITTDPDDDFVKLDGEIILEKEGELCIPEQKF